VISIVRLDPKTNMKQKVFGMDMKKVPYPQQIKEILNMFCGLRPRFRLKKCVADYTGCGRPVVQLLIEQGFNNLIGIIFNAKDKLTNTNASYKTAMGNYFIQEIENNRFKYPSLDNFILSVGVNNQAYYHKMMGEHADLLVDRNDNITGNGNAGSVNMKVRAAPGQHDDTVFADWAANYAAIIDQKMTKMPSGISYRMNR